MILIINICKENLHLYEFVYPIRDILIKNNIKGFIRKYDCLTKKDLEKASKVIICGTSLKDNDFLNNLDKFKWIKKFNKPTLGICGGMQIIGLIYGGNLKKKREVGFYKEKFKNDFLNITKDTELEVYHLHNNYIDFSNERHFKIFSESNIDKNFPIVQAVKHNFKEIYGVLFHPEVRNKEIILNFARL